MCSRLPICHCTVPLSAHQNTRKSHTTAHTELGQQVQRVVKALIAAGLPLRCSLMTGGQAEEGRRFKALKTQEAALKVGCAWFVLPDLTRRCCIRYCCLQQPVTNINRISRDALPGNLTIGNPPRPASMW